MNAGQDKNCLNIEALSTSVVCPFSCDGLICFYSFYNSGIVVNPTNTWHRSFPPPMHKQLFLDRFSSEFNNDFTLTLLGFGKDKFNGTYTSMFGYITHWN